MNKLYLLLAIVFFIGACATRETNKLTFDLFEKAPTSSRLPANASQGTEHSSVELERTTVKLCGVTFDSVTAKSSHPSFYIDQKSIKDPRLEFNYSVPGNISVNKLAKADVNIDVDPAVVQIENPFFPEIPLLPLDRHPEICVAVKKYHAAFSKNFSKIMASAGSNVLNVVARSGVLEVALKGDLTNRFKTESAKFEAFHNRISTERSRPLYNDPHNAPVSLIIFDDLYMTEVFRLRNIYRAAGHNVRLLPLSKLPGLDADGEVPAECQGAYLRECYHFWGDPIDDVSQLAVPGLKGFFRQRPLSSKYGKVSYIPGLIRAYIRSINNSNGLKGVLLVGNDDHIAPFYTHQARYLSSAAGLYFKRKLATDIFYALPYPVLVPLQAPHYEDTSSWVWTCVNASGVTALRTWCKEDETRHWPTPPLLAYGFAPVTPHSRVMKINGSNSIYDQFSARFFPNLELSKIVPVGRIYTRDDHNGDKDPAVEIYVNNSMRWHKSLPSMNTAIASHGGGDDYAYQISEVNQFERTFGTESKIYASEHFINSYKCNGRCEYIDGRTLMESFDENVNRSVFLFTAHGSVHGFQLPYGGANGENKVNANVWGSRNASMGWIIHPFRTGAPEVPTLESMENGTLFGTVVANSCDINDFQTLENEIHPRLTKEFGDIDQRPIGQQILQVPNGGAVNAFVNVDVGWAWSDSEYNAKFMQKMQIAHNSCADVGEAARLTWYDMLTGNTSGAGVFQLMNRQLLGSPFNPIARKPAHCAKKLNQDLSNEI
jgi:hypothetical protein